MKINTNTFTEKHPLVSRLLAYLIIFVLIAGAFQVVFGEETKSNTQNIPTVKKVPTTTTKTLPTDDASALKRTLLEEAARNAKTNPTPSPYQTPTPSPTSMPLSLSQCRKLAKAAFDRGYTAYKLRAFFIQEHPECTKVALEPTATPTTYVPSTPSNAITAYDYLSPSSTPDIDVYGGSTSYNRVGNTTYGSDGSMYNQVGDTVYGNDGSMYNRVGNTVYGNDGSMYNQVGNTTYGSDGSMYNQIGNTTYGSNGSICNKVGNTTYCN